MDDRSPIRLGMLALLVAASCGGRSLSMDGGPDAGGAGGAVGPGRGGAPGPGSGGGGGSATGGQSGRGGTSGSAALPGRAAAGNRRHVRDGRHVRDRRRGGYAGGRGGIGGTFATGGTSGTGGVGATRVAEGELPARSQPAARPEPAVRPARWAAEGESAARPGPAVRPAEGGAAARLAAAVPGARCVSPVGRRCCHPAAKTSFTTPLATRSTPASPVPRTPTRTRLRSSTRRRRRGLLDPGGFEPGSAGAFGRRLDAVGRDRRCPRLPQGDADLDAADARPAAPPPEGESRPFFSVGSMAALPGAPLSVAMVLSTAPSYYGYGGAEVRVFDDGVPRATGVKNVSAPAYVVAGPPGYVFGGTTFPMTSSSFRSRPRGSRRRILQPVFQSPGEHRLHRRPGVRQQRRGGRRCESHGALRTTSLGYNGYSIAVRDPQSVLMIGTDFTAVPMSKTVVRVLSTSPPGQIASVALPTKHRAQRGRGLFEAGLRWWRRGRLLQDAVHGIIGSAPAGRHARSRVRHAHRRHGRHGRHGRHRRHRAAPAA